MKVSDIRAMSVNDIQSEINDLGVELMKMRMGHKIGMVENPMELRNKKRTIARMKTILTEKQAQNS